MSTDCQAFQQFFQVVCAIYRFFFLTLIDHFKYLKPKRSFFRVSTDFQALKQFFQVVSVIFCAIIQCFSSLDYRSKCSSQYFILSPWDLIIISTRLPIEDIVLSMVSIGTLYRAFRILATNSSRLSFVIFFADFRRSLFARWNTFSMG